MADIDVLPARGVPALALVDSTGIATNGSATVAQLAAKGIRSICAVDATGVSVGGASVAQLASAGIRAFCPVDENGVSQAGPTADALRSAGIRPMVLLNNTGVALTGSASMLTLAQRGLSYFCPLDESGNATTMGAVVLLSNSTIPDTSPSGTNVGTLSVSGGTGTYTFTLTSNPGSLFVTAGTNGINLNTAATLVAGSYPVTVQAAGGVPTPISRVFLITVTPTGGIAPNAPVLTWTSAGTVDPPTFGILIDNTVMAGDLFDLQHANDSIFTTPITASGIISASDISGLAIVIGDDEAALPAFGFGTWYVRARVGPSGHLSNYSNTVTGTITAAAPVNTVAPVISGSAQVGQTLTTTNGTWTGAATIVFTYQWKRAGVNIAGATGNTYLLVTADAGTGVACAVTGTNGAGNATAISNSLTVAAATYQGPGDVIPGAAVWGSLARAYSAAFAATAGSIIDIVDSSNANAATIHCLTTGFCDLATLNAWVAAHGTAYIKKVYDQTGNGNHWTQPTVANMPTITQNALNGLPGMTFTSAGVDYMETAALSINSGVQPLSLVAVAKRTLNNTTAQQIVGGAGAAFLGFDAATATAAVFGGVGGSVSKSGVTDNVFHAMQGVLNGANSFVSADGQDGAVGTTSGGISAQVVRFGRGPQADAVIMEGGIWPLAFTGNPGGASSGNILAMNANLHSATNGYNF